MTPIVTGISVKGKSKAILDYFQRSIENCSKTNRDLLICVSHLLTFSFHKLLQILLYILTVMYTLYFGFCFTSHDLKRLYLRVPLHVVLFLSQLSNLGIMTARLLPALQECFKSEYVSVRIEAAMVCDT